MLKIEACIVRPVGLAHRTATDVPVAQFFAPCQFFREIAGPDC
jgi:hypothetical protein